MRANPRGGPGARFNTLARMDVKTEGLYTRPEETAEVRVRVDLAGEELEAFQAFMERGYPADPAVYPPTRTSDFEDLGVEITLRWPPLVENLVRAHNSRMNAAYDELSRGVAERSEEGPEEQTEEASEEYTHDPLLDEYEKTVRKIEREFERASENPARYLLAGGTEGPSAWSLAEVRYERWVYAAAERLGSVMDPREISEAEEELILALDIARTGRNAQTAAETGGVLDPEGEAEDREDLRHAVRVLLDVCGNDTWYAQEAQDAAEELQGDKAYGDIHVDVANVDTDEIRRVVITPEDLRVRNPEDLRALHAKLSAEIPRPASHPAASASEALILVDEMERALAGCWEMAEDLGVGEEVLNIHHAIDQLGWTLSAYESGALPHDTQNTEED